jgi:hypothetical protein
MGELMNPASSDTLATTHIHTAPMEFIHTHTRGRGGEGCLLDASVVLEMNDRYVLAFFTSSLAFAAVSLSNASRSSTKSFVSSTLPQVVTCTSSAAPRRITPLTT